MFLKEIKLSEDLKNKIKKMIKRGEKIKGIPVIIEESIELLPMKYAIIPDAVIKDYKVNENGNIDVSIIILKPIMEK